MEEPPYWAEGLAFRDENEQFKKTLFTDGRAESDAVL